MDLEAVMLGDKENLHYVVGLTGNEYSIILDLDNFNKIKDLTRIKLGLTINGIMILRDDSKKFENIIKKYNENKLEDLREVEGLKANSEKIDVMKYLYKVVDILNLYNIDSQGFMEYMRSKIEQEGIEIEKIWKEAKDGGEKRYIRCLMFDYQDKTYILDSIEQKLLLINRENFDNKMFITNPEENQYTYQGG